MIGQSAADPSVRVRKAAVEPQAWRFHCAAGEDDHLCFFRNDVAGRSDAPCDTARDRLCVRVDTRRECIRQQRDRSPSGRPLIARQRHRNIADRRGALGLQVNRRTQRLEAALRTMAAECTSLSEWEHQHARIARSACIATRLQDRVLLWPECSARDVLRRLHRKTEMLCASEKDLFLETHRRGFNRQRVLNPIVIRQELPVTEGKQMILVIGILVCPVVVCKHTGCSPWRVSLIVIRCSAYP